MKTLVSDLGATAFWHQHRDPGAFLSLSRGDIIAGVWGNVNVYATIPNGEIKQFLIKNYNPNDEYESMRKTTTIYSPKAK